MLYLRFSFERDHLQKRLVSWGRSLLRSRNDGSQDDNR
jgi:hypothetical protein